MSKKSEALRLPRKVSRNLETVGEQIKLARKRRGLSIATMCQRAQCSELTLMRVEKGVPTVSIGIYARILYGLGLDDDILLLAQEDRAGNAIINSRLLNKNEKHTDENVFD